MATKMRKNDQPAKVRLGSIGENLVVAKLMQQGWDAFNANCTIKNYKSIDIVCLNADLKESDELWWKPKTSLVQVKTSVQNNIPAGFSIEESLDKKYLESMVKGPYVFVSAKKNKEGFSFRFFISSLSNCLICFKAKIFCSSNNFSFCVCWESGVNRPYP